MFQVTQSTTSSRRQSGRFDLLIIAVIALLLVAGLIYVLFQIIGHSEEHVDTVRKTKVIYKESLRWRPDLEVSESRVSQDLNTSPNRKSAEYLDLNLNENSVKLIGRMSRLQKLNLDRSTLQDPWLEHLIPLPLRSLSVEGNPLTDKAVPYILRMPKLTHLSIGDTELTDEGLKMLSASRSLTHLKLNLGRCVTNDGIKHVGQMKQLTEIQLTNPTTLTGKCLADLTNLKDLNTLNVENMLLTPEDLGSLSSLKKLHTLEVSNCQLTDQSMVEISKISSLKALDVTGSYITGKGLMLLTKLKLNYLKAKHCPDVDEKSLDKFRLALPRCVFQYSRASSMSEKMSQDDVKMEMDFLQDEVRQELERTKNVAK